MRIGLGPRLFFGFLGVALVGLASAGYLVDRNVERAAFDETADRLRYEVTMTGQMTASALFAPLAKGDTSLQGPIRELGASVHTHLSLVTPDGAVVADSDVEPGQSPVQDDGAPEIAEAIKSGRGEAIRGQRLWVAEAVRRDGNLLGIARASVPVATIQSRVTAVRKQLALGAGVAMLIAALSALLIALGIVRPVRRLASAARRIGEGGLDVRANIGQDDEIGDLGRALDEMAANIQSLVVRLDERNVDMQRVLDTVDQGLVTVDLSGAISSERSARVNAWFGTPEPGAKLWSLFRDLGADAALAFEMGWAQLAESWMPVEVAIDQLPKRIGVGTSTFELRYLPIGADCESRRLLVAITDVTAYVVAERVEAVQRDLLRAIDRTQRDRGGVVDFLRETDVLVGLVGDAGTDDADLKRHVHTLKGNCLVFGIQSVASCCHALETKLVAEERSITDTDRDALTACWTEVRDGIASLIGQEASSFSVSRDQFLEVLRATVAGQSPSITAAKLADWVLTPVDVSLRRLGEHAGELATRLGKKVEVLVDAGGLRLDNERWGPFWAAYVHAVRNAVDHGLELPDERVAAGKLPAGTISLSAEVEQDFFAVELRDDGRGIAWSAISERLRERGLPAATAEQLTDGLFLDGLSTARDVTDVSGRGIGMGALRAAVAARGGRIEVRSTLGVGMTLRCVFPACATMEPSWVLKREIARQAAADSSATVPPVRRLRAA